MIVKVLRIDDGHTAGLLKVDATKDMAEQIEAQMGGTAALQIVTE